jgi:hypothetical protein
MRSSGRLLLVAAGFATLALQPSVPQAAPSPSPALSKVLVAAPSDFVEADTTAPGMFEGAFDAKAFVDRTGAPNASGVQQTLARDGFVDGYWRTWVQSNTHHVLVEIVIAFSGGDGANSWLRSAELADKSDPNYQHPISISGISAYYGARFFYKSNSGYGDVYSFTKGNDYFGVIAVSPQDDLGTTAADQTKAQYAAAPDTTIPQSQWPASNTASHSLAYKVGSFIPWILFGALILGLVLIFVTRSRRGLVSGVMPAVAAFQMSADGGYWWDGQQWRDAKTDIPPQAQRTADGQFWWDGQQWRPVA